MINFSRDEFRVTVGVENSNRAIATKRDFPFGSTADFPCQSEEVTHEATKLTNVLRSAEDDPADCSPAFPAVVPVRLHTAGIDGS